MDGMKTTAEIVFLSYEAGVTAMVRLEYHFEPDARNTGCTTPGSSATGCCGRW